MSNLTGRFLVMLALSWGDGASAAMITDTVTVDGTEWAQLDLFSGISWNEINIVCPSGLCIDGGVLNGYDMTGWTWAVTNDVNAVFNYYIGSPQLGPGPDWYQEYPGSFAASFFAAGWRATQHFLISSRETVGLMSDNSSIVGHMAELPGSTGVAATSLEFPNFGVIDPGGWFYRGAPPQVPGPATLPLFCLALTVLGFSRRKLNQQKLTSFPGRFQSSCYAE